VSTIIASLNVRGASKGRSKQLAARLRSYEPTVLLLTETPATSRLFELLAPDYPYLHASGSDSSARGAAVLSKAPLIALPTHSGIASRCAAAIVSGNTFVALYGPAKWKDAMALGEFWNATAGFLAQMSQPVVVSGDLNMGFSKLDNQIGTTRSWKRCADPNYQQLLDAGLTDAWRHVRGVDCREFSYYPSRRTGGREPHGRRLDHMLVSSSLEGQVQSCYYDHTTREYQDGQRVSDHSAMILKLQ
jgi:exonuclease III